MQQIQTSTNSDRLFIFLVVIGSIALASLISYFHGIDVGRVAGMEAAGTYYFQRGEQQGLLKCRNFFYEEDPTDDPTEETL